MDEQLKQQLDGLLEKYTELLLGEGDEALKEKVQAWALYTHISKSMPPLVKHWNEQYPDAKEKMKELVTEIQALNKKHRSQ
ncbi:YusU family protein [Alkalihalobacterium alkalinitrilicum]|uniref:YusU family protein n=1 Tax=Alkalihalobacterium alkalinitrilicum TaxID=427920 RepID=UPI000995C3A6|nr:YusU family protein [Alkalihalobacterium alkalinitrilicum]